MQSKNKCATLAATLLILILPLKEVRAEGEYNQDSEHTRQLNRQLERMKKQIKQLTLDMNDLKIKSPNAKNLGTANKNLYFLGGVPVYIGGTPVVSSPYISIQAQYNASDLIVNLPYINEDLFLLHQKRNIGLYLKKTNFEWPSHPVVELSGTVQTSAVASNHAFGFSGDSVSDVDLTAAEVDFAVLVNNWTMGYMAVVYDNSPAAFSNRIDNSNIYIDRAFITFGRLSRNPYYGTLGQLYIPYGQYSSAMLANTLVKSLFRTKARTVQLGYSKDFDDAHHLSGQIYAFHGPTHQSSNDNGIHNYGANVDYKLQQAHWDLAVGGGGIKNIADSLGIQHNGNPRSNTAATFAGLDSSSTTEIVNPVAGLNVHVNFGFGNWNLIGEYCTATTPFDLSAVSFNNKAAKISATHGELGYNFNMYNKPTSMAISIDKTQESLAFLIPKSRYSAVFNTSLIRDTVESLEFRHDKDYSRNDVANGITSAMPSPPIQGTGLGANTLTLQLSVYF